MYVLVVGLEYFIDVQDASRLHVAAAILPIQGERIFASAKPFNFNTVLEIMRGQYPVRTFMENFHASHDLSVVGPRTRAEKLLKDMGRSGFTLSEDSILTNIEALRYLG